MNWYLLVWCATAAVFALVVRLVLSDISERRNEARRRLDEIERKANHAASATSLLVVGSPSWEHAASLRDVGEVRKELKELADAIGYEWGSPSAPWRGWHKKGKRK